MVTGNEDDSSHLSCLIQKTGQFVQIRITRIGFVQYVARNQQSIGTVRFNLRQDLLQEVILVGG